VLTANNKSVAGSLGFVLLLCCVLLCATEPDKATRRWWSYTEALAADNMEGRDTGSKGYAAAEDYVIQNFRDAGLSAAGTDGFRQPVPMRSRKLNARASAFQIFRDGSAKTFDWFRQVTVAVRPGMPHTVRGPLYFIGDPATLDARKTRGAIVVVLGVPRIRTAGAPPPAKIPENAAGSISVDSLGGPEPPIWPVPYAASVTLAEASQKPMDLHTPVAFRINPDDAELLFVGTPFTCAELQHRRDLGQALPNFAIPGTLEATLTVDDTGIVSDNILATLPGSDPVLRNQYVVLSAHLDGYGIGEPRNGDAIYNGAFDDAAYVALLIDLAQSLHDSDTTFKRSLLFCVVTGEEKGLLGSRYFAAHPTIPKEQLAADLNLDQLRPIFPLKILTVLGLHESTLGQIVEHVAQSFGIRIQADPEPERNLLRRSDHFSFMQIGVPALNFVFGYEKGSPEEKSYREWYAERYHSPADDLAQPWDPEAAAKFNHFYAALVKAVANAPERPQWTPGSQFAKEHTN